jgi:predicted unusual protein kinase regulating ubiquinone biosynthesis (AarF/ABC1/UbiB family)
VGWYGLLGVVATALAISALVPTTRRVWAFHLYLTWHVPLAWLASALGVRRLWCTLRGRAYRPFSGPLAARLFCEDMGPTFIKFGQIVASSAGMFPDRYSEEFRRCLDEVRPFEFAEVERIVADELGPDKAAELEQIDRHPLASASIAQVHTAKLTDGRDVVIKVQRPAIDRRVAADMKVMRLGAAIAQRLVRDAELANPVGIVEDFAATIAEELDFRLEASNLDRFNEIMRELGHGSVRAPVPAWNLTTRRVLVMERFFGVRVDRVPDLDRDVDGENKLIEGMRAWFQSVVFYGFFHGDVHAGNLMLLDNDDLGFLDFGFVGRFDEQQRGMVTDYLIAFSTGDYTQLARVIAEMGGVSEGVDIEAFARDLEATYRPLLSMKMGEINYAEFIPKIQRIAARHRMVLPREFVLITKQMLYFDRYAKLLAPTLNVFSDPRLVVGLMQDIQKAKLQRTATDDARG